MTMLNVQFKNKSQLEVISYFGSPQDSTVWPNLGEISSSDPRWKAYYDAQPESFRFVLPSPDPA